MNQQEEISRSNEAKMITTNPLYVEAFMVLRGQMMEQFTKTTHDQSEERDEVWRTMKCLDAIEAQFKAIMNTGKLAIVVNESMGAPK